MLAGIVTRGTGGTGFWKEGGHRESTKNQAPNKLPVLFLTGRRGCRSYLTEALLERFYAIELTNENQVGWVGGVRGLKHASLVARKIQSGIAASVWDSVTISEGQIGDRTAPKLGGPERDHFVAGAE